MRDHAQLVEHAGLAFADQLSRQAGQRLDKGQGSLIGRFGFVRAVEQEIALRNIVDHADELGAEPARERFLGIGVEPLQGQLAEFQTPRVILGAIEIKRQRQNKD